MCRSFKKTFQCKSDLKFKYTIKTTIQYEIYWNLGLIGDVIQILPCIILCIFQEIPNNE